MSITRWIIVGAMTAVIAVYAWGILNLLWAAVVMHEMLQAEHDWP